MPHAQENHDQILPLDGLSDVNQRLMKSSAKATVRGTGVPCRYSLLPACRSARVSAKLSMVGIAVLIGVSNDVPSTSQIPRAHRQAVLALELADVSDRVVQFSEIPVRRLMLHFAREELQHVLPAWIIEFFTQDKNLGGVLTATLRAYADANMNVLKAAARLSVHPNTVYFRFQKIREITGLDAKSYHALSELLIVVDCGRR